MSQTPDHPDAGTHPSFAHTGHRPWPLPRGRWTWRQSEHGKITGETGYVFFPIDGFLGFNDDNVRSAAAELEGLLKASFGCDTISGFVDREHPDMDITL